MMLQQTRNLHILTKYFNQIKCTSFGIIKSYSIYPSYYKRPVFSKDAQETLSASDESDLLAHVPILPALGYQTSSQFYDPVVSKFINYVMRKGKKEIARNLVERAFETIKRTQLERYHKASPENRDSMILNPVEVLHMAIENSKPIMELTGIKKGGTTYQVPVPLLERRQIFLAMNWLIKTASDKNRDVRFSDALAKELIDASNNQGRVVKKKQDLHKQCEANRAYAHYRWS